MAKDADALLNEFRSEVAQIEKRDAVWTNETQVLRLTRPGSTYFNLNPFDVLQLDPFSSNFETDLKKQYRKLSILVHPDKNRDKLELSEKAMAAVGKANTMLNDKDEREKAMRVARESKKRVEEEMEKKRKAGKVVEEDNPEVYRKTLNTQMTKLFVEIHREIETAQKRDAEQQKRKRDEEDKQAEKRRKDEEEKKKWEESRETRVNSWRDFAKGGTKKKKTTGGFRPPALKTEKRG
eukprot:Colp12_sorted_trinity150504_noHs@5675